MSIATEQAVFYTVSFYISIILYISNLSLSLTDWLFFKHYTVQPWISLYSKSINFFFIILKLVPVSVTIVVVV